ncbi:hypothetical protein [Synechococcus sp. MIT S1220]|uniref:hypothetical protein n=1 Tax=Synechococcus sp. MIT S1220 TaxID=3082549 RepID=UPI0039B11761
MTDSSSATNGLPVMESGSSKTEPSPMTSPAVSASPVGASSEAKLSSTLNALIPASPLRSGSGSLVTSHVRDTSTGNSLRLPAASVAVTRNDTDSGNCLAISALNRTSPVLASIVKPVSGASPDASSP